MVAEEGVVAGFDREDGSGCLHYLGIGDSEARNDVNDSTDTDRCDDVGQSEELICVGDWKIVFARRESGRIVRFQYVLGRLHMDELLRLHARDNVDGVVVLVVRVPFCEVLQPFKEKCRLHVLKEVDAAKVRYGGGGDV